jgi:hypothetical protein
LIIREILVYNLSSTMRGAKLTKERIVNEFMVFVGRDSGFVRSLRAEGQRAAAAVRPFGRFCRFAD